MAADFALLPSWFLASAAFALGACLGSFLNVCIVRWPALQSVVSPPSRCPRCGAGIRAWQNIPIVGWLLLRGKCGGCRLPISPMYPLVELVYGVALAYIVVRWGVTWEAARLATFVWLLLGIGVADAREMIIPDEFSLGGTVAGFGLTALALGFVPIAVPTALCIGTGLAYLGWEGTLEEGQRRRPLLLALSIATVLVGAWLVPDLRGPTLASATGFGALWAVGWVGQRMAGREAMGGGDLKLMMMVGAFTNLAGVFLTVFLGALIGALVFVPIALFRKERHMELPFGVFLAPAALAVYLHGGQLIDWYLGVSGLR